MVDLPDVRARLPAQAIETLTAASDDAGLAYGWTFSAYLWLSAAQAARMEQAIKPATEHAADASLRTDDV